MQEITIIQEPTAEKPFCIVSKPRGLPSAPLSADDFQNCFCRAAAVFPELKAVSGRKAVERGLLHRLDTETEGLLLIAQTQEFYDFMIEEQKNGRFEKTYEAITEQDFQNAGKLSGFPPAPAAVPGEKIEISSYFRNFGPGLKSVRPVTEESGKAALKKTGSIKIYRTEIFISEDFHAVCKIREGYRHQVRCHLAWCGYPIKGDRLYNASCREGESLHFKAAGLRFNNPITGKQEFYSI